MGARVTGGNDAAKAYVGGAVEKRWGEPAKAKVELGVTMQTTERTEVSAQVEGGKDEARFGVGVGVRF